MDNDSSHSNSDLDTPDPLKPRMFWKGLYGFTMQEIFGLIQIPQFNPDLSKQGNGHLYKELYI